MKCTIPEISWHNRDPVLAIDIQPNPPDGVYRLATAGTDTHIVIWQLRILDNGGVSVEALSDLTRHNRAVNAVRFSPDGEILASADDEAAVILWKKQQESSSSDIFADDSEKENKEHWTVLKMLRGHLEDVYDLSWSKCSQFLISGSVDNSAILWDVGKGKNMALLNDHKGFVQGVTWDPQGQYVATLCSDRNCRIYNTGTKKLMYKIYKATLPVSDAEDNVTERATRLFHDDTLKSFCRRLSFSPDGEILLAPSGVLEEESGKITNVTYVFSRHCLSKPVMYLPTKDKYTMAVRFSPILYELKPLPLEEGKELKEESREPWEEYANLFHLPYRMVFAVATQNAVLLYDTQQPVPFAKISNIHYTRLSDVAWSSDGRILVVSSTDGYCSLVSFTEEEIGIPYKGKLIETQVKKAGTSPNLSAKPSSRASSPREEPDKMETEAVEPPKKPVESIAVKSSKSGKRVSLITLSGPTHKNDENTPAVKADTTQPQVNGHSQGEAMEVDEETRKKFEGDDQSPTKGPKDPSPAKTPTGVTKTPRRVPLIMLSSPKGKKNIVSESR
ncbi:chromatin assembly factor 1 subunit B-like isoform X1 [Penaeus chinensis]|uniref:chromatin assembly factor 1 subunit B-like isoform X1 n=1 Tax=Penaeus chinensis TaxID=139456 RepID=UPI001FB7FBE1|nr:chromatin assembly factor 1 subunit B-like isoform X1 [Penaeus chinensis]